MYFTICIPTYNRGYILHRTLDSIKKQNFISYEVIVVDDGSNDNTEEIVSHYIEPENSKFRYIKKPNGGKHSALNVGIENARGLFFIILDSDDWLADDALQKMYELCTTIEKDNSFCGIMGRMLEKQQGEIEGTLFDLNNSISSYFEFHFLMKKIPGKKFNCIEANKTKILKQIRYPEMDKMTFVPEAWLFDQIGVHYNLLLSNDVFCYSEYLQDGMNADKKFKIRHNLGFLYHYISRLENVLPAKKLPKRISIKLYTISWLQYWNCVHVDKNNEGPRISYVSFYGKIMKIIYPVVFFFVKSKFNR